MQTSQEKKSQVVSNLWLINDGRSVWRIVNATIFNTMRILKKKNPGDTYLENYLWHYNKRKDNFLDSYHLMWWIGSQWKGPKNILEIGCRTGISICQLLSSMVNPKEAKVILCDVFNDGFISPDIVKMNIRALNLPEENIEFKVGDSKVMIPKMKEENPELKFDYILVDGDHAKESAKIDLENTCTMLNPGGYLLFDDITPDGCSLQDVWDEFVNTHDGFEFFENHDGKGIGWAIRKM